MRRLSLLACLTVVVLAPAALAQTPCSGGLSATGPTFNATLNNPASLSDGFAAVSLNLNGTSATVDAETLGINGSQITGLSLFQGSPGNGQLVMTFTDDVNRFQNGSFSRTVTLDPELAAQIAASPSNYFFALATGNGTISGPLATSTNPVLAGMLTGQSGSGNFLFSFGTPNHNGDIPLSFDVTTAGIGNDITSLQILSPDTTTPFFTLGTNLTATNGRITGTTLVNSGFAQQLIAHPCGLDVAVNTLSSTAGPALVGSLAAGREVFIPVAGATPGLLGNRWKTDLNIYNADILGNASSVMLQFIPTGGSLAAARSVSTVSLPPRGSASTRDITTAMFNGITGIGAMRIISSASVFANARVYDDQTGSGKGTLGQSVPGLSRSQALRQGVLVGLTSIHSGASGANSIGAQNARTNVGFFNPNDTSTTLAIELRDSAGAVMGSRIITLGPFMHMQLPLAGAGGLFVDNNSDFAGASVSFLAGAPLFAYASIIDNDSGDGSFVLPSSQEP